MYVAGEALGPSGPAREGGGNAAAVQSASTVHSRATWLRMDVIGQLVNRIAQF